MKCRLCAAETNDVVLDLLHQPPSNAYLNLADLEKPEHYAPLKVYRCSNCELLQLPAHFAADHLFSEDYAYFSSTSTSWLQQAKTYADAMVKRFALTATSKVYEVASNDGYLLQYFKEKSIPCLGIEPTRRTAEAAIAKGIPTKISFLTTQFATEIVSECGKADLIAANNVLAHVPDINDFVAGFKILLAPDGVITFEFPHLLKLVQGNQFDTIYHEHFSYLLLTSVSRLLHQNGLRAFDVEELPTHGGSLRVFVCHAENSSHATSSNVTNLLETEQRAGIHSDVFYADLAKNALAVKLDLITFLVEQKRLNKRVAAFGAAAKGNTLLNYCGVSSDLVEFVCDSAASKQGRFMPGSHIPILPPSALRDKAPDYVLILPWNLKAEITSAHPYIKEWGGQFAVAIPQLSVIA
jgi:SAM-dependent methyltransferase